jgi:hypothetical protein
MHVGAAEAQLRRGRQGGSAVQARATTLRIAKTPPAAHSYQARAPPVVHGEWSHRASLHVWCYPGIHTHTNAIHSGPKPGPHAQLRLTLSKQAARRAEGSIARDKNRGLTTEQGVESVETRQVAKRDTARLQVLEPALRKEAQITLSSLRKSQFDLGLWGVVLVESWARRARHGPLCKEERFGGGMGRGVGRGVVMIWSKRAASWVRAMRLAFQKRTPAASEPLGRRAGHGGATHSQLPPRSAPAAAGAPWSRSGIAPHARCIPPLPR